MFIYIYKNICIPSLKSNVGRNIQSRSLLMAKRKHPVQFFCPSITINPSIHPPSFRLSFSRHRIIFAGGYDNDNDEEEVQEDEDEGEHVTVTLTQDYM
jgi:hypothetical protein